MKIKLTQLFDSLFGGPLLEWDMLTVNDLFLDSRTVDPGSLFVAIPGSEKDGRHFIDQAIERGSAAILAQADGYCNDGVIEVRRGVPIFYSDQLTMKLPILAQRAYSKLPEYIIGVTGTNGKSTTTYLIASLVGLLGQHSVVMGTLGSGYLSQLHGSINTTGDILTTYRQLSQFKRQGVEWVAMEVSSHGLCQRRVDGIPFSAVVFTNLTHDHLDYHSTMSAYGEAKARLFMLARNGLQLVNLDDPFGAMLQQRHPRAQGFSLLKSAAWQAKIIGKTKLGSQVSYQGPSLTKPVTVELPLLGAFNVSNWLAAMASLNGLGIDSEALLTASSKLSAAPGRMELFCGHQVQVVVDYAHTPDALQKALQAIIEHCCGRIFCIFGCGGDRDKSKRPLMARIAERYSDVVILTNDNPRTEDPQQIIGQMLTGLSVPEQAQIILDRRQALESALMQSSAQDMILLAGKGHECYQLTGTKPVTYDERSEVTKLLRRLAC